METQNIVPAQEQLFHKIRDIPYFVKPLYSVKEKRPFRKTEEEHFISCHIPKKKIFFSCEVKNFPQIIQNTREIIENMSEIIQNISDIFFATYTPADFQLLAR